MFFIDIIHLFYYKGVLIINEDDMNITNKKYILVVFFSIAMMSISNSSFYSSFYSSSYEDSWNISPTNNQNVIDLCTLEEAEKALEEGKIAQSIRKFERIKDRLKNTESVRLDRLESRLFPTDENIEIEAESFIQTGIPNDSKYVGIKMQFPTEEVNIAIVGGSTKRGIGILNNIEIKGLTKKPLFLINYENDEDNIQLMMDWTVDDLPLEFHNKFDFLLLEQFEYENLLLEKTYENAYKALKPGGTLLFHGYRISDYYFYCINNPDQMGLLFDGKVMKITDYFIEGKLQYQGFDVDESQFKTREIIEEDFFKMPVFNKNITLKYKNGIDFYKASTHNFYITSKKPG